MASTRSLFLKIVVDHPPMDPMDFGGQDSPEPLRGIVHPLRQDGPAMFQVEGCSRDSEPQE